MSWHVQYDFRSPITRKKGVILKIFHSESKVGRYCNSHFYMKKLKNKQPLGYSKNGLIRIDK